MKAVQSSSESVRAYCNRLTHVLAATQATDGTANSLDLDSAVRTVVKSLLSVRKARRKVMVIGNGGSAAIATHFQNDLCNSVGLRALVFYETSLFSAIANDHGAHAVFERPIQLFGEEGDMLIALSSSGRSENILRAVNAARAKRCQVVTLSGFSIDNPLRRLGDINFHQAVNHYGMVELAHQVLLHSFADFASAVKTQ